LNSKKQQEQIDWRRAKVLELLSKGETNQSEIARMFQVDKSIISKDVDYLRRQAQGSLQNHIQEKVPEEYQKCLTGINQVLKTCWNIVNKDTTDDKTKLQATAIINDSYKYLMGLTTNGVVITDAIRYAQGKADHLKSGEKVLLQDSKEHKKGEESEEQKQQEHRTHNGIF